MKTIVALCLIVGVALAEVHVIPLRRRQSLMEKKILDGTWADYVKNRDLKNTIILASGGSPLKDYSNVRLCCKLLQFPQNKQ